jgi:hypothetical protein
MLMPTTGQTTTSDLQQKTQGAFITLSLITQACHGILNTVFIAPTPKPVWFDDLQAKLDDAKVVATDWITNIAPGVTGGVPVQVINYGTTYSAVSASIQSIVEQYPDAQGADDKHVQDVHRLVSALEEAVQGIITNAQTTAATLATWGTQIQKAHDELTTGAASIQTAETNLTTDIQNMNSAIDTLNKAIHQENLVIAGSAAGIGVGLLLVVAGIALAPESGGASLVVAGTGGVLIIGGAVAWGLMQAKINGQFKQIAADQNELQDDQRQIVALQGLSSASNQSIQYTTDSSNALSDFRTSWVVFQGELQGVMAKLQSAESSLSTIVAGAFTAAADAEWADATAFAQSLVNAPVSVKVAQLPMDSKQAA